MKLDPIKPAPPVTNMLSKASILATLIDVPLLSQYIFLTQ